MARGRGALSNSNFEFLIDLRKITLQVGWVEGMEAEQRRKKNHDYFVFGTKKNPARAG